MCTLVDYSLYSSNNAKDVDFSNITRINLFEMNELFNIILCV